MRKPAPPKAVASDRFEFPIKVGGGKVITTVGEAFNYIDALPEKTQQRPEWQLAIEELHHAVTKDRAWMFFARFAINGALAGKPARTPETAPRIKKGDEWRDRRAALKKR